MQRKTAKLQKTIKTVVRGSYLFVWLLGCSFVTRQAPKSICFIIKDHFDHGFDSKAYLEFKSILGCSFMAGQDPWGPKRQVPEVKKWDSQGLTPTTSFLCEHQHATFPHDFRHSSIQRSCGQRAKAILCHLLLEFGKTSHELTPLETPFPFLKENGRNKKEQTKKTEID